MNINDEVELVDIASKDQLLSYYSGISELFSESFNKTLDKELWEWAYLNNPFGEPLVSIALHNKKVVGHYAVIPLNLENNTDCLLGFLSMTTMVGVDFRKHRLFQRLAEMVYTRIENTNLPSMVFGFPNDNSVPGFIKRLGWSISENYKVVSVKPEQINTVALIIDEILSKNHYTLNMGNPAIKKWRTEKPGQTWIFDNEIGIKGIGREYDLMHISSTNSLKGFEYNSTVNMILPLHQDGTLDDIQVAFPYRFGYRLFNTNEVPELFVQMSMSDVF